MALAGKKALVKRSGSPTPLNNEDLTHITDTEWQVTTAAKRVLAKDALTVEWDDSGWTDVTANVERFDRLAGKVIFESGSGFANTEDLRINGNYLPMTQVAEAHEYSVSLEADLEDVTPFQENFRKRIPCLKSASGSLNQFDVLNDYFLDALLDGDPIVLELYPEDTMDPIRLWALLNTRDVSAAVASPQDESVGFESEAEVMEG